MNSEFAGAVWAALRGKRSTARSDVEKDNSMATQLFQPPHGTPAWFHHKISTTKEITSEKIILTPELAHELLKNNDHNRGVSPILVAQFSSDIANGRWALNGEPLIFSKQGDLNDGQHRCHAVIDANTPIEVMATFGVERDTRTTVDLGKKRTLSDKCSMHGIPNAALTAAITTMVIAYERSDGKNLHDAKYVSSEEAMARVFSDANISRSASYANHHYSRAKKYVGGSAIGCCHYILSRIDPAKAEIYLDAVCNGEGLKRNDPAYSVRDRLLNEGKQRDKKVALILRGWTFFRRGRTVSPTNLPATLPFPALF